MIPGVSGAAHFWAWWYWQQFWYLANLICKNLRIIVHEPWRFIQREFAVSVYDAVWDSLKMTMLGVNRRKNMGGGGCLNSCQLKAHNKFLLNQACVLCKILLFFLSFKLYTVAVTPQSGLQSVLKSAEEACNKTWSVCIAWEGRVPGRNTKKCNNNLERQRDSGCIQFPDLSGLIDKLSICTLTGTCYWVSRRMSYFQIIS